MDDVLTTIFVCLTLLSWLSNVKIQVVRVSLQDITASIQSKPNCSCTKVPIAGSRQILADSLILDDLRNVSQFDIAVIWRSGLMDVSGNVLAEGVWFGNTASQGSLEESKFVDAEGVELGLEPWLISKLFNLANLLLVLLYALLLVLGIIAFVLLLCLTCCEMLLLNGDGLRPDAEIELLQLDDER